MQKKVWPHNAKVLIVWFLFSFILYLLASKSWKVATRAATIWTIWYLAMAGILIGGAWLLIKHLEKKKT